ncbi:ADP-heptose--LPS heptosyltransferase [Pseudodesulfovibrio cashew]|uniref:ADP-heptose--LPS heptosyltransferase n=1 Tax=Pseudodesulfovibrio cashew TaxID=2678688 RepID=A0A6I6JJD3_9BACT|nr:glycosyltransferase family 9 protein [Pseudodesulfovibrio cashew]QGY41190.1 ADP-heptose--LPS heptosyltransferase [Pseudodesulfovibrio cashew]
MKHYLVIQLARFGDLIQTKRLLATLCAREDAEVHLCVDHSLAPLARLVYPQITVHSVIAHGTGLSREEAVRAMLVKNRDTFSRLAAVDFERVYNINFSPLNFRLAALFDPDRVEGFAWRNGQEITGLWPSMAMRWARHRRLGINLVDFWAGYCPDAVAPETVNPAPVPKGGGIGVVLAGRESRRSLPVTTLARITATLAMSNKTERIHLLGGKSEQAAGLSLIKELPARLQSKTVNLAGKTDWASLTEVVESLDMLITPDTGTMHLAAHLGTPVAAFFLSSAWCFETGPYGQGHWVYQAVSNCLPCLETQPCPHDVACLGCFNSPEFLRFITTEKPEHAPDGLIAFTSEFDALGQIYTPMAGEDTDAADRAVFRNFLLEYLTGTGEGDPGGKADMAGRFFHPRDWTTRTRPGATIGI